MIAAAAAPRRRAAVLSLAIACASISAMTLAPVANAETTHLFQPTTTAAFGSISGGLGLAVDQSNGDVYAAALNGNSINKYTANGEPVTAFGGGSGDIAGFGSPWQLAVDQASHDLYVSTESGNGVYKVDSNGNLVTTFGSGGKLAVARPIGVAVNPTNGDLYVASYEESKVEVFTAAGVPVTEFGTAPVISPLGVAVNSSGEVFVDGGGFGGPGGLARFSPTGSLEARLQEGAFQGVTIDPATGDVYASQANEVFQYSPTGDTLISEFGSGVINDAWGVGVDETTGQVYAATYYGSSIDVFGPEVIVADVTTDPSSPPNIEHTSAKLTGHVDLAGGPTVTECFVEYGTTTEYSDGKIPCDNATPIDSSTDISATIGGLAPLSTYHYRFVAKNENGPGFGQDQTVAPPAIFGLQTVQATETSTTTTTLNGTFRVDSEGGPTHYSFEWGLSTSYGHKTSEELVSSNGTPAVDAPISGLSFFTLYHYRVVATNDLGTEYGQDRTVKTAIPGSPVIASSSSSGPTPEGATLEAVVDPEFGPTLVRFDYGQTSAYGEKTPPGESIGEDGVNHLVTRSLSGLRPGQTYHYRAVAVNFGGQEVGPDRTFNTTDVPRLAGTNASAISQTGATLAAQVKPGFSPTSYHFEYGLTPQYGTSTGESGSLGADNSFHEVTTQIVGLLPGTTYHYRVVATNGVGEGAGPDDTFTTAAPPEESKVVPPKCKKTQMLRHGHCVPKPRHRPRHHHGRTHKRNNR